MKQNVEKIVRKRPHKEKRVRKQSKRKPRVQEGGHFPAWE